MSPLTLENVESELSYAYLHAVASHAKVACEVAGRHEDNAGVDARLIGWGPFPNGGYRNEIDIKVQLKATIKSPTTVDETFSYSLSGISRYDDLRSDAVSTPRILVVLFLPENPVHWITHTEEALALHNCAYWVSLRGAKPSTNKTAQTVYLPKSQRFDVTGLVSLMSSISRNEIPRYQEVEA
ncbi:DUF4365 domain-containing protein [Burkholderia ambifaria]|uniref:DUF4365 domain-containing protein n=1 Tax=Burkholderia ambifaria TaxID=152480 RepID=UPI00158F0A3E|nr:DUF4365 domain-containing protein [Burkholderia ambifaria]WDR90339.1 DUF4365 domain-containing protein [Burkholderia ambifaria]WDS03194.1 DUF4365 domain-containing protein [Burkholderia ambifaria]